MTRSYANEASGQAEVAKFLRVLDNWRSSLVDLSGRNRLLNFKHTRTSTLELTQPSLYEVVAGLSDGWGFARLPDEEETGPGTADDGAAETGDVVAEERTLPATRDDGGLRTQKTTAAQLRRSLRNLRSNANRVFNDYGLWTLYVAAGFLEWREEGAHEVSAAPLVLIPVQLLQANDGSFQLRMAEDEDPRHNPALPLKLEQFGVDWSTVLAADPLDIATVLAT
ncbi:DUF4011 domain-containing protein, partial [Actinacidiphila sp. bgisy160]|uniref:DUF4011 domain-containing protein n=1 Tax=Actinacidiphila sp. bgisy160 TaxID=3413796 RepID=UPI003D752EC8